MNPVFGLYWGKKGGLANVTMMLFLLLEKEGIRPPLVPGLPRGDLHVLKTSFDVLRVLIIRKQSTVLS